MMKIGVAACSQLRLDFVEITARKLFPPLTASAQDIMMMVIRMISGRDLKQSVISRKVDPPNDLEALQELQGSIDRREIHADFLFEAFEKIFGAKGRTRAHDSPQDFTSGVGEALAFGPQGRLQSYQRRFQVEICVASLLAFLPVFQRSSLRLIAFWEDETQCDRCGDHAADNGQ